MIFKKNKKINVCVYFENPSIVGYPFSEPAYVQSYMDLFALGSKKHPYVSFYVVRATAYQGNGKFTRGQWYNPRTEKLVVHAKKIQASVVFNKCSYGNDFFVSSREPIPVVNNHLLDYYANNKMLTALLFPEFHTRTFEVRTLAQLQHAVRLCKGGRVVLKPRDSFGGDGVQILSKKDALTLTTMPQSILIVQEFMDTKAGIPGLVSGVHDFRLVIMNGKIAYAYIRQPKKGSLLANFTQGGSITEVARKKIPKEVLRIMSSVESRFKQFYPRIYSIDCGRTTHGYKVFEMNTKPMIPHPAMDIYYKSAHKDLLDTILSAVK